jgi:hypothetical protein
MKKEFLKDLLVFVKSNSEGIAQAVDADSLEDIMIDDFGDVGATGIYIDEDGDSVEGGLAFRFFKDVDDDFLGEDGEEPILIKINGIELMYVGYNI